MTFSGRHVAFDWGGVLTIGTFDGRSTQNMAERSGVAVDKVRESYFRHVRQLEVGAWSLPQFWETVQQETGMTLPYSEFEPLYLGSIVDNEPMYATLAALPRSVRVGLLADIATFQPAQAQGLLHIAGADSHPPPEFLRPGDLLVLNDTRVIPARLTGTRSRASRPPCARSWRRRCRSSPRLI